MNKLQLHTTCMDNIKINVYGKKPDTSVYMVYGAVCMSLNVRYTSIKVYLKLKSKQIFKK